MSFRAVLKIQMQMKLILIGCIAVGILRLAAYIAMKRIRVGRPTTERPMRSCLKRCFTLGILRFFTQILTVLKRQSESILQSSINTPSIGSLYFCTLDAFLTTCDATVLADFIPFFAPLRDRVTNFLNRFFHFFCLSFFFEGLVFLASCLILRIS